MLHIFPSLKKWQEGHSKAPQEATKLVQQFWDAKTWEDRADIAIAILLSEQNSQDLQNSQDFSSLKEYALRYLRVFFNDDTLTEESAQALAQRRQKEREASEKRATQYDEETRKGFDEGIKKSELLRVVDNRFEAEGIVKLFQRLFPIQKENEPLAVGIIKLEDLHPSVVYQIELYVNKVTAKEQLDSDYYTQEKRQAIAAAFNILLKNKVLQQQDIKQNYQLLHTIAWGVEGSYYNSVDYLSPQRRFEFEFFCHQGKAVIFKKVEEGLLCENADTENFSSHNKKTWASMVVSLNGNCYRNTHKKYSFHHSAFVAGELVQFSGEILIDAEGYIVGITDYSGHYAPNETNVYCFIQFLENKGFDLSKCHIYIEDQNFSNFIQQKRQDSNVDSENSAPYIYGACAILGESLLTRRRYSVSDFKKHVEQPDSDTLTKRKFDICVRKMAFFLEAIYQQQYNSSKELLTKIDISNIQVLEVIGFIEEAGYDLTECKVEDIWRFIHLVMHSNPNININYNEASSIQLSDSIKDFKETSIAKFKANAPQQTDSRNQSEKEEKESSDREIHPPRNSTYSSLLRLSNRENALFQVKAEYSIDTEEIMQQQCLKDTQLYLKSITSIKFPSSKNESISSIINKSNEMCDKLNNLPNLNAANLKKTYNELNSLFAQINLYLKTHKKPQGIHLVGDWLFNGRRGSRFYQALNDEHAINALTNTLSTVLTLHHIKVATDNIDKQTSQPEQQDTTETAINSSAYSEVIKMVSPTYEFPTSKEEEQGSQQNSPAQDTHNIPLPQLCL